MAWYRAGTVTVTNGSTVVTGAATDFVANTGIGEAFLGPDGRTYEIAAVVSATQLTLASGYMGGTAGAQGYATMPTSSFARDLALGAAQLLNTFAAVRDGIGAGLIPDGTIATPAIRFAADQDTGLYRANGNVLGFAAGGIQRMTIDTSGIAVYGQAQALAAEFPAFIVTRQGIGSWFIGGSGTAGDNDFTVRLNATAPAFRLDTNGNLLIGITSSTVAAGPHHSIRHSGDANGEIIGFGPAAGESHRFYTADAGPPSGVRCVYAIDRWSTTGRSINAAGTVNASGADYAEYMTKAAGCGTIGAGDVCGVDADGRLTRTWADAVSFVVKSTDPAYVGGDTWAASLPARPERGKTEAEPAFTARLATWEAQLEAERVKVDRIAFAGQVPVNVTGSAAAGDYLIAAADGPGIKAVAVTAGEITFDQYRRRIGKVWAIRGGRPWVDVQHG